MKQSKPCLKEYHELSPYVVMKTSQNSTASFIHQTPAKFKPNMVFILLSGTFTNF